MSKEGDKASVFRTTKIKTKLKDDTSWLRRSNDQDAAEAESQEEKPWLVEVRASRLNGAPETTSPASSPVTPSPPPPHPDTNSKAPAGGYRSRGIYTPPSSTATPNGFSKATQFTKPKPSDSYKKIAPHTVRPPSEDPDSLLSVEEQEKRTEAASSVLKKSSVRQRSYVLSAASKFESPSAEPPEGSNTVRTEAKQVSAVDEEPVAVKLVEVTPQPAKKVSFEDTAAGRTPVATPLPELIADCIQAASTKPPADISRESEEVYDISRPAKLPTWPPPKPTPEDSDVPELPAPVLLPNRSPTRSDVPEPPAPVLRPTVSPTRSDFPEPPSPVLLPYRSPTRSDVPEPPAPVLPPIMSPTQSDFPEPPSPILLPIRSPTRVADVPEPAAPVLRPTLSPIQSDIPELPAPVLLPNRSPTRVSDVPEPPSPVLIPVMSPILVSDVPEPPSPVLIPVVSPTRVSDVPEPVAPVFRPTLSPIQSDIPELPAPVLLPIVSPTRASAAPLVPVPMSPTQVSTTTRTTVRTEPEPEPEYKTSPKPSSNVDMLAALSDTLLPLHTTSASFRDDEPKLAKDEGGVKDSRTTESRSDTGRSDTGLSDTGLSDTGRYETGRSDTGRSDTGRSDTGLSDTGRSDTGRYETGRYDTGSLVEGDDDEEDSEDDENLYKYEDEDSLTEDECELDVCEAMRDDLQPDRPGLEEVEEVEQEEQEDVVPGNWSQELLSKLHSQSVPTKSGGALDFLTDDVIAVGSEARSSMDDQHVWSSRVTTVVTENSSADPFDPYPIGTASPNSSSDLLRPLSSLSISRRSPTEEYNPTPETRMSGGGGGALESLADDVIGADSGTTRISSRRSWARTWDTGSSPQEDAESSQQAEGHTQNQETVIKFERMSSENDSPWDRWTSPTVYSVTSATDDHKQEQQSSYGESQTITTVTTVREIHRDVQPAMDRYESFSRTSVREQPPTPPPEPEAKKGFLYLKEYVNSSEMSSLNSAEGLDRNYDYLTSNSINYNYSSPKAPLSSTCTFCGQQVGDDSKITIEHLGINCHPTCFKCGVCGAPMGDLLHSMFLHAGKVHCESCYSKV